MLWVGLSYVSTVTYLVVALGICAWLVVSWGCHPVREWRQKRGLLVDAHSPSVEVLSLSHVGHRLYLWRLEYGGRRVLTAVHLPPLLNTRGRIGQHLRCRSSPERAVL
ncbi:hypothetical protein BKA81DRAFT_356995 [Phyllosticta paracitricarpa]